MTWTAGLLSGALLAANPPTILVVAVLFAPSLLTRIAGDGDQDGRVRAVLLCNAAASVAPLLALWRDGRPTLDQALAVIGNPRMLFAAWLAASFAWLGSECLAVAADRVMLLRAEREIRALDNHIAELRAEWDLDPDQDE